MVSVRSFSRVTMAVAATALMGCASTRHASAGDGGAASVSAGTIDSAMLRRDLTYLASDSMRGREAGTLDELRATAWVAKRAREVGLEPAGDDGTFLQFWPMRRVRQSGASMVTLNGVPLALWRDVAIVSPVDAQIDAPLVWVGDAVGQALAAMDVKGKVVAAVVTAPSNPPGATMSLSARRYAGLALRQRASALVERGAAAVILVSDSISETQFDVFGSGLERGRYGLDTAGGDARGSSGAPVLWVRQGMRERVAGAGARLTARLSTESFVYPSVNIVAKVPGTDPALREEYVLFSGHQDHDGVRYPVDGDSIWNGADDNATVSVALLAIGRAVAQRPMRRSALFVWHGAEERGLLGSRWFVAHPTVPRSSIVAVLNGDMIGRNAPDSAALLGVQPPHRNSSALVTMALDANARVTHFALDTLWDRPTHPEGWYFRSDHLPYARAGIPAIFFSTLLHSDYHTPRDEASRIDIAKLARMSEWMYATGWAVGTAPVRPGVEPGFKLER